MVKVKGPPDASTLYTKAGRTINLPPDRLIEVTEEDAVALLRAGWERA
jgi:hypothetical protein